MKIEIDEGEVLVQILQAEFEMLKGWSADGSCNSIDLAQNLASMSAIEILLKDYMPAQDYIQWRANNVN